MSKIQYEVVVSRKNYYYVFADSNEEAKMIARNADEYICDNGYDSVIAGNGGYVWESSETGEATVVDIVELDE